MKNQFSLFDLLILIGIVQGVITSILLLKSRKNTRSNIFLALALLSFCLINTKPLLHTLHLWETTAFRFFPNSLELALSPLIYFYITSLVNPSFSFKVKYWFHFIPFIISQMYAFVVYFIALGTIDFYQKDQIAIGLGFNEVKQLDEKLLLVSLPFYLFFGFKELRKYKKWLEGTTSDNTFPDFNWLKNIFQLSVVIGIFLVTNHSLDFFLGLQDQTTLHYNLLNLFIAFLIYYLGLKGYLQPDYTFSRSEIFTKSQTLPSISTSKTVNQLQKVMKEDKAFLNPKLSIYELSDMLGISQKNLSQVINQHFNIPFRDYINNYRLEEVKSKLSDAKYSHMSILGIALECGFNSEASFYRIFKKSTGLSPKEFIMKERGN